MKKALALLLVLVMITAVGCKKDSDKQPETVENSGTGKEETKATPTLAPTTAPTEAPTQTPTAEPTATPTAEPTPEPAGKAGYDYTYDDFVGTWYLNRGEIEGYEWTAEEEQEICRVVFSTDSTASQIREFMESDPLINTGDCTCGYDSETGYFLVYTNFGLEDAEYSYSINENGELEECGTLTYDGSYQVASYCVYTREPFWGEGNYYDRFKKTVPEKIQQYIDNAPENAWLVAIADPDKELSKACDEGNWNLVDETGNEWVKNPWNNPKELIIANSSDREVSIEIHEPAEGYDTRSSEKDWEPGSFMYCDYLKPGELCRFIVDMPDKSIDATMCMYMEFDGGEKYYLRVYKYDNDDPYITF